MKLEKAIQQDHFADNCERAIINILYTANWIRDLQNSYLKEHGLLMQHYNALRVIKGCHPNPVCPGGIKEVLLDKSNDVTRLLDKLVEKGLIKRTVCSDNRRKVDVMITPKGQKFLDKVQADMAEVKSGIKKRLSDKEARQLSSLLDSLRG